MEIYHNPKSVLPRPLKGTEDVLPGRASHEGLSIPHIDSPPGNWYPDPVQPSARDLREILFSLDSAGGKET